jgi:hypothetical protein
MIILITKLTCRNSKTLFRAGGRAPLGVGRHKGPAGLGSRRLERRGGLERWIGTHRTGYDRGNVGRACQPETALVRLCGAACAITGAKGGQCLFIFVENFLVGAISP